jgi:outer membrane protein OmpA-like peptidoglycan-associated protein
VSFTKGSSELSNEAKYVLDQIGENLVVNIEATASPEGTAEFNQKLSDERAETVSKYLTDRGLKVNSSVGKGVNTVSGRTATIRIAQ